MSNGYGKNTIVDVGRVNFDNPLSHAFTNLQSMYAENERAKREDARYQDTLARQKTADERAATEWDQKQKAYQDDLATREWLKTYDPTRGGGTLSTEMQGRLSPLVSGEAQRLTGEAGLNAGFNYDRATPEQREAFMRQFEGMGANDRAGWLREMSTGIGGRVDALSRDASTAEDVRAKVYRDVLARTGDVVQASAVADQISSGFTSRADLMAAERSRVEAENKRLEGLAKGVESDLKRQMDIAKFELDVDKAVYGTGRAAKTDDSLTMLDVQNGISEIGLSGYLGWAPGSDVIDVNKMVQFAHYKGKKPAEILKAVKNLTVLGTFDDNVKIKNPDEFVKFIEEQQSGTVPRIPSRQSPRMTATQEEILKRAALGATARSERDLLQERFKTTADRYFPGGRVAPVTTPTAESGTRAVPEARNINYGLTENEFATLDGNLAQEAARERFFNDVVGMDRVLSKTAIEDSLALGESVVEASDDLKVPAKGTVVQRTDALVGQIEQMDDEKVAVIRELLERKRASGAMSVDDMILANALKKVDAPFGADALRTRAAIADTVRPINENVSAIQGAGSLGLNYLYNAGKNRLSDFFRFRTGEELGLNK